MYKRQGDGCIPIFRAAEMMYNEAEAQYRLGNEQAVRALLEQTVNPYNADYTCTKSGDSLWEELKAYRKFDLCNEGHSWFDLKPVSYTHLCKSESGKRPALGNRRIMGRSC